MTVWGKGTSNENPPRCVAGRRHSRAADRLGVDRAGDRLFPLSAVELHDQPDAVDLSRRGRSHRRPHRHPRVAAGLGRGCVLRLGASRRLRIRPRQLATRVASARDEGVFDAIDPFTSWWVT